MKFRRTQVMITREQLKSAIDQVDNQHLETVYQIIQSLQHAPRPKKSFMQQLQSVKINAPSDFASNIDA